MRYHRPRPRRASPGRLLGRPSTRPRPTRLAAGGAGPGPGPTWLAAAAVAGGAALPGFLYARLADLVLLLHLGFVLFVILGALLVLWRRWIAWIHLPCAAYGAAIEFAGWVCPLTPLENRLREAAGQAGYEGGFIEHYAGGLLYPENWEQINVLLGVLVIMLNAFLYAWILTRGRTRDAGESGADGSSAEENR